MADGPAVVIASGFIARTLGNLISGTYTVGNGKLFKLSAPEGTIIEFRDNPIIG